MTWYAVTWVSAGFVGYGLVGIAAGRVLRAGSRRMPGPDAANSATGAQLPK